ncbi:hypothetical protein BESB_037180 [Besnoitia besnoiti]|uniref:Uncharacterized protein n=1 Tax=Besnoitia besnoiti TaxID=94643 RepID=A0A2A9MNI4_BESBE|nr:hypothetical protein BESB_037180 [Besnoitia besnoiti]PFH37260.1 hypothetical protein BESB_037180 [Besnoitia besnoiti]
MEMQVESVVFSEAQETQTAQPQTLREAPNSLGKHQSHTEEIAGANGFSSSLNEGAERGEREPNTDSDASAADCKALLAKAEGPKKDEKETQAQLHTWHAPTRSLYLLVAVRFTALAASPSSASPAVCTRQAFAASLQEALERLSGRLGAELILADLLHFEDNLGILRTDTEGAPSLLLALHQIAAIGGSPCHCVLLRTSSVLGALAVPRRPAASLVLV